MKNSLVTVICLCYNHAQFLIEAVDSVLAQDYSAIQIIVIDDASTDNSQKLLKEYYSDNSEVELVLHDKNQGNCKSFNEGLILAKGEYIIDFATDDVMLFNRIAEQIKCFESDTETGVVYTNTEYIDDKGAFLTNHRAEGDLLPSGNVFSEVLMKHVYEPSSIMVRKSVFDELGGYDESLAYEDFDFVLRSSRLTKVAYIPKVLTKRRKVGESLSSQLTKIGYKKMFESTYRVCEQAHNWCETAEELKAWDARIKYESRHAYRCGYKDIVKRYIGLMKDKNRLKWYRLGFELLTFW